MSAGFEDVDYSNDSADPQKDAGTTIELNRAPNGIPEADSNFGNVQGDEVIAELAHHIVAGGLPVRNLHTRGPVL